MCHGISKAVENSFKPLKSATLSEEERLDIEKVNEIVLNAFEIAALIGANTNVSSSGRVQICFIPLIQLKDELINRGIKIPARAVQTRWLQVCDERYEILQELQSFYVCTDVFNLLEHFDSLSNLTGELRQLLTDMELMSTQLSFILSVLAPFAEPMKMLQVC